MGSELVDQFYTEAFDCLQDRIQDFLDGTVRNPDVARRLVNDYAILADALFDDPRLDQCQKNSWGPAFSYCYDPLINNLHVGLAIHKIREGEQEPSYRNVGPAYDMFVDNGLKLLPAPSKLELLPAPQFVD